MIEDIEYLGFMGNETEIKDFFNNYLCAEKQK